MHHRAVEDWEMKRQTAAMPSRNNGSLVSGQARASEDKRLREIFRNHKIRLSAVEIQHFPGGQEKMEGKYLDVVLILDSCSRRAIYTTMNIQFFCILA